MRNGLLKESNSSVNILSNIKESEDILNEEGTREKVIEEIAELTKKLGRNMDYDFYKDKPMRQLFAILGSYKKRVQKALETGEIKESDEEVSIDIPEDAEDVVMREVNNAFEDMFTNISIERGIPSELKLYYSEGNLDINKLSEIVESILNNISEDNLLVSEYSDGEDSGGFYISFTVINEDY